jgi:hypothetical protein
MAHLTYSQTTQLTQDQQKRIDTLFTPEKIIEYSKSLSNELRQRDTILSLEFKIKSLKQLNNSFYANNQLSLYKIDTLNKKIENNNKLFQDNLIRERELFATQLRKEKGKNIKIAGIGLIITAILLIR